MNHQICNNEPSEFVLLAPNTLAEAAALRLRFGDEAQFLAGGCDLLDQMKHQWRSPQYLINLKALPELAGIRTSSSAVRLGSLTTLGDVERDNQIARQLPALSQAAARVATPQIRNTATVGGNLLQDSRCAYYRAGFNCYRAGGVICDAHHGLNAEHAIFGGDRCYTVIASDLAPALVALDAEVSIRNSQGLQRMAATDLYLTPSENLRKMNRLDSVDILTEVRVPLFPERRSSFVKYAIRSSWDFALVSASVSVVSSHGICRDVRIVVGAVASYPLRRKAAEQMLVGQRLTKSSIAAAADASVQGATALEHNEYKIALTRRLVGEALSNVS